MTNQICSRIINENIRAVETDMPLTMPLTELNADCRFKQFYNNFCDNKYGSKRKAYYKAYYEANKDKIVKQRNMAENKHQIICTRIINENIRA